MIRTVIYIALFYFLWQTGLLSMILGTLAGGLAWLAVYAA